MKMKMGALLAAVALTLTGCSSNTLSEQEYYDLVHETEGLSGLQNDNIKAIGEDICGVFKAEDDPYTASLDVLTDGGYEAGEAGALIALSVAQYCPDQLDSVPTP